MSGTRPRRVVIDCDPGIDDTLALWLALGSPAIEVAAITVVGGNVGLERTLANACGAVALAGAGVPVHRGAGRPLLGRYVEAERVHGADGIGGVVLPGGPPPQAALAADALRALLRREGPPVTLVGIGPATNLALALATEPALATRVEEIVLMTGAWSEGNYTPSAEFNAYNDPEALARLLDAGPPVTLATLDLTAQALATPARIAALRAGGAGACRAAACDMLDSLAPSYRLGGAGAPLHDPCTIAWLLRPALFTAREVAVSVGLGAEVRGRTIVDRWSVSGMPANARLLETLDADGFFALLDEALAALP